MRLDTLIAGTGAQMSGAHETAFAALEITGLTSDSRAVKPGMLFAAMPGTTVDGAAFISAAIAAGAVAVLCSSTARVDVPDAIAVIRAIEPRLALARLAANFYPRQPSTIVAVTGTSGKSSIADFTRQIFAHLGHKAASVGTIGVVTSDGATYGSLTTPDPISLHQTLDALAAEGITHLAFEASSHGLDQFRVDGVRIAAAAFVNLGRDHLDYHPTTEAYLAAKLRLFALVQRPGSGGAAVINMDGNEAAAARAAAAAHGLALVTVGRGGDQIRLHGVERDGFRQRLHLETAAGRRSVLLPLVGTYQVENALVAAGLAQCFHDITPVLDALEHLRGVPGRLDIVGQHNGGLAVVDYAHKPEALAAALDAVRPFATGKLICVFGCGGNRDKGKRPLMGDIAVRRADVVIVTDDNPRNEDPATVRAEILAAARGAREIGDRAAAIRAGVAMLSPGDVLLVAGKGHETGQIIAGVTHPFSDHAVIAAAIHEARA